jgi:hypothetical protein
VTRPLAAGIIARVSGRHVSYTREAAPGVEVLHEGASCHGTLHEWRQHQVAGPWHGWVRFHVGPGDNRIGTFHQADIRLLDPAS